MEPVVEDGSPAASTTAAATTESSGSQCPAAGQQQQQQQESVAATDMASTRYVTVFVCMIRNQLYRYSAMRKQVCLLLNNIIIVAHCISYRHINRCYTYNVLILMDAEQTVRMCALVLMCYSVFVISTLDRS